MKVAIIGAGDVGRTSAQRIAEADLADLVLVDIVPGKAMACALDLSSASSIMRYAHSISGRTDFQGIAAADIVVVAAGKTRQPGESRADLLKTNAAIVQEVSQKITRYAPSAIVIVVTNPLDEMTYLTYKTTGFAANQVMGMGGVSDASRFNMLAAQELDVASQLIESIVIGAHGNSMVVLPRLSSVKGEPITELLPEDRIKKIIEETKGFGGQIVKLLGHGSAYYGPSAGVFAMVEAIVKDRKSIFCASVLVNGEYGLKNLCIGVPVKIGRMGIEEIIELKLTKEEKAEFLSSAELIKKSFKNIGV